ncbi:Uncharacterised protein [Mycobacterium tuberculosis]|nr:Uncharacterised protein [Mycobacterium tuberculosis]
MLAAAEGVLHPAVEQPQCAVASAVDEHPEVGKIGCLPRRGRVRLLHHFQRRTQRLGILGRAPGGRQAANQRA